MSDPKLPEGWIHETKTSEDGGEIHIATSHNGKIVVMANTFARLCSDVRGLEDAVNAGFGQAVSEADLRLFQEASAQVTVAFHDGGTAESIVESMTGFGYGSLKILAQLHLQQAFASCPGKPDFATLPLAVQEYAVTAALIFAATTAAAVAARKTL